jgi:DNA-binding MarR family transcriptional regulator
MSTELRQLQEALLDLTGVLSRSQPDAILIKIAGIDLERVLFPLLSRIERRGPLGVGELADLAGRDYTTVSRQVTKLARVGLVTRRVSRVDSRVREVAITEKGRSMATALDAARERLMASVLAEWDTHELQDLVRLTRRLADDALAWLRKKAGKTQERT